MVWLNLSIHANLKNSGYADTTHHLDRIENPWFEHVYFVL